MTYEPGPLQPAVPVDGRDRIRCTGPVHGDRGQAMTQFGGRTNVLRFGIHSGQVHGSFEACRSLWRAAEQLDYDLFSLFDRLRPHLYPSEQPCFEGSTLLGWNRSRCRPVCH